ncbi:hypothetical protein SDC9_116051 [bioreactor metagenome]|uniref:Uncharacterized protein n=1 Tax=bioreactor metagenome TaxID=1076179 RepID=A0A645BV86_9ZZZZ
MDVSRENDLVPILAGGEDHALHAGGSSADHEERVRRAKRVRREFFRVLDHRNRMTKVIERFHRVHVDAHAFFAQQLDEFRIAASPLVPRHIERDDPLLSKAVERLVDGRALLLVEIHVRSFRRLLPRSKLPQIKNRRHVSIPPVCRWLCSVFRHAIVRSAWIG